MVVFDQDLLTFSKFYLLFWSSSVKEFYSSLDFSYLYSSSSNESGKKFEKINGYSNSSAWQFLTLWLYQSYLIAYFFPCHNFRIRVGFHFSHTSRNFVQLLTNNLKEEKLIFFNWYIFFTTYIITIELRMELFNILIIIFSNKFLPSKWQ